MNFYYIEFENLITFHNLLLQKKAPKRNVFFLNFIEQKL